MTPLHFASQNGSIEIVKLLIENGVNINVEANIFHKNSIPYNLSFCQILHIMRINFHLIVIVYQVN